MTTMRKFGWRPEPPDVRDEAHSVAKLRASGRIIAPHSSLDPNRSIPIRDQGDTGSCVGNSRSYATDLVRPDKYTHSARFAYYEARKVDGFEHEDQGAYIRSAFKALGRTGACVESVMPWSERLINKAPTATMYKRAATWKGVYAACNSLDDILWALSSGHPVTFGFTVYENIGEADLTGILPLTVEGQVLGGHAVTAFGHDVQSRRISGPNSWGDKWGDKGWFHMPFDYFNPFGRIVDDAWALITEA